MPRAVPLCLLAIFALVSCASIAEQQRTSRFEEISESYRRALLASDFNGAAFFLEPARRPAPADSQKYSLVKIFDYNTLHVEVAPDKRRIEQLVELQFYLLNINRLRSLEYHQVWIYNEANGIWLLQTALPDFN